MALFAHSGNPTHQAGVVLLSDFIKMQYAIILIIVATLCVASAFTSAPNMRAKSTLSMNFKDAVGAQPPLGFWDPLGLLQNADQE